MRPCVADPRKAGGLRPEQREIANMFFGTAQSEGS